MKICYFGIRIILGWRQLRISRFRKGSALPLSVQSRTKSPLGKVLAGQNLPLGRCPQPHPSPIWGGGEQLITREGEAAKGSPRRQALVSDLYVQWVSPIHLRSHNLLPQKPPFLCLPLSHNISPFVKMVCTPASLTTSLDFASCLWGPMHIILKTTCVCFVSD